jgi:hypothetical protein
MKPLREGDTHGDARFPVCPWTSALRKKQSRDVPSSRPVQLPLSDTTGHAGPAGDDIND